ncbi:hypothetical protein NA57DRAFT_59495 [Rhizodiscina lignyota]|uniref:Uncharacterized protein n=1 Tax=Rhizodiscina lignyota TaxID=1504668 RepID=A0A9P4I8M6_9PEZI|nr:hypothetical protein NA57DRAFT_59495 [Rhizodiscina lignyota]
MAFSATNPSMMATTPPLQDLGGYMMSGEGDVHGPLYITPFHFVVGPEKEEMMAHKELLCHFSPFIETICKEAAPVRDRHAELKKIRDVLKECDGLCVANQVDQVKKVIGSALRHAPEPCLPSLQRDVNDSYMRTLSTKAKNKFVPPVDIPDWINYMVGLVKSLEQTAVLGKIFDTVLEFFNRQVRGIQKSQDPNESAVHNKLHLPHMSVKAVQLLINSLYTSKYPVAPAGDKDPILTFCYLHGLTVQLQMDNLANYCMSYLAARHVDLMQYSTAVQVLEIVGKKETMLFFEKLRRLVYDMLVCTDASYITASIAESMQLILEHLSRQGAVYVAKASTRRARAFKFLQLTPANIPQIAEIKAEYSNRSATTAFLHNKLSELERDTTIPFQNLPMLCERYHCHKKGQRCFMGNDEVKVADEDGDEDQEKTKSERNASVAVDDDESAGNDDDDDDDERVNAIEIDGE